MGFERAFGGRSIRVWCDNCLVYRVYGDATQPIGEWAVISFDEDRNKDRHLCLPCSRDSGVRERFDHQVVRPGLNKLRRLREDRQERLDRYPDYLNLTPEGAQELARREQVDPQEFINSWMSRIRDGESPNAAAMRDAIIHGDSWVTLHGDGKPPRLEGHDPSRVVGFTQKPEDIEQAINDLTGICTGCVHQFEDGDQMVICVSCLSPHCSDCWGASSSCHRFECGNRSSIDRTFERPEPELFWSDPFGGWSVENAYWLVPLVLALATGTITADVVLVAHLFEAIPPEGVWF